MNKSEYHKALKSAGLINMFCLAQSGSRYGDYKKVYFTDSNEKKIQGFKATTHSPMDVGFRLDRNKVEAQVHKALGDNLGPNNEITIGKQKFIFILSTYYRRTYAPSMNMDNGYITTWLIPTLTPIESNEAAD